MKMIKFRSKKETLLNPRTGEMGIVCLIVEKIEYVTNTYYKARVRYYKQSVDGSFQLEEKIEKLDITFTLDQLEQIETETGGIEGTTFTEKFNDLIVKATMREFANSNVFGLQAADWEQVLEEETPEVENGYL